MSSVRLEQKLKSFRCVCSNLTLLKYFYCILQQYRSTIVLEITGRKGRRKEGRKEGELERGTEERKEGRKDERKKLILPLNSLRNMGLDI